VGLQGSNGYVWGELEGIMEEKGWKVKVCGSKKSFGKRLYTHYSWAHLICKFCWHITLMQLNLIKKRNGV
jgi:hypothetical protein